MEKGLTLEFKVNVTECSCGSGKEPSKCCGPMKRRICSISMDESNYYESDGIAFNKQGSLLRSVNGELKPLIGQPKIDYGYSRTKGTKVLVSGEVNGEYIIHPESVLIGYENIFAIDTNTKIIGKDKISLSAVVHAYINKIDNGYILNFRAICAYEFWNVSVPQERLGWYALINAIQENSDLCNKTTAVIVDSDLGELEEINRNKKSILNDFYLPELYKLVYASADSGSHAANKLIKLSDKKSNEILTHIQQNPTDTNLIYSEAYQCDCFRQWVFNS